MTVSKRLRFEVLRRDEHTCQYCGESAPDAKLHVDHVVPVALGGTDDPGNLVAACKDCNSGKTSVPADAPLVKKVSEHSAAYALAMTDKMTRIRATFQEANEFIEDFKDTWNQWKVNRTGRPVPLPRDYKESLRRFAAMGIPSELIEHSIEVAMSKTNLRENHGEYRYMCGVIWRTLDSEDTPYVLTEKTAATYTDFELREQVSEAQIEGYTKGWDLGYKAGYTDRDEGYSSRLDWSPF